VILSVLHPFDPSDSVGPSRAFITENAATRSHDRRPDTPAGSGRTGGDRRPHRPRGRRRRRRGRAAARRRRDATTQALRGYLGGVDGVTADVERRADLALAKAEAVEAAVFDGEDGPLADAGETGPPTDDDRSGPTDGGDGSTLTDGSEAATESRAVGASDTETTRSPVDRLRDVL
jgi:hypothetical protein